MLGFVIFALVAFFGLLVALVIMFWPTTKKAANELGIPGDFPSNNKTGNAQDIAAAGSLHDYLCGLHARHGPLTAFHLGQQLVVSAASPKLFDELKSSFNRPADLFKLYEPLFTSHSLLYLNTSQAKERHRHFGAAFQGEALQNFYSLFVPNTMECIGKFLSRPSGEHVNITRSMFQLATSAFSQAAFGSFFAQQTAQQELQSICEECWHELEQRLDLNPPSADRKAKFEKNQQSLCSLIERCIKYRRQGSKADLEHTLFIDRLLGEERNNDETIGEAATFLFNSLHTTAYLLVWAVYYLSRNKNVQDKVAAEVREVLGDSGPPTPSNISKLRYTKQVVDETLRCSVLSPLAARYFDADTELGGYEIPAKVPVIAAIGVVLQDVTIWPQPERFDPERFSPEAIKKRSPRSCETFGLAGRRCPGFQYANTQAVIILSLLCRQVCFSPVSDKKIAVSRGIISRPTDDVEVTLKKR
eukprot:scpid42929/ scgid19753/ Cytochrome P450 20A1